MNTYDYFKDMLPSDHYRQSHSTEVLRDYIDKYPELRKGRTLDLGCGVGKSREMFRELCPEGRWIGVDIEWSPEVNARAEEGEEFVTYDGANLPFEDASFDLVYSVQVLEHVRHVQKVLAEVRRVLRPGGVFLGQTSQLEPYHSYSYWNFTLYGFTEICRDAGLQVELLRPGIDGPTLIDRSRFGRPASYSKWFTQESPVNREIGAAMQAEGRSAKVANFRKLMYCGQFIFACRPID